MHASSYIDRTTERPSFTETVRSLYRYRELLRGLVAKDLKLKYRGSTLGVLWSLIHPLVMVVVYTIAFTFILNRGSDRFVFLLLVGILTWTFFASSAVMSSGSLIDNQALTKSLRFPRAILPLSSVAFNLAQYLLTILVFLPIMFLYYGVRPTGAVVLFPALLALQVVFTCGVALLLASLTALFRDVRHLVDVALAVLFWATPIVYPLSDVPATLRPIIQHLPLAPFIVGYQTIFLDGAMPSADIWATAAFYAAGTLVVGVQAFFRVEPRFAELM